MVLLSSHRSFEPFIKEDIMYESYFEKLRVEGKLRNLTESSIRNYSDSLERFLRWVKKSPEELTCEDVRNYILFKQSQGVSATTINMYNSGIRFFYRHVLQILWDDESVPRLKIDYHVPVTLSPEEIDRLLQATPNLKYRVMLSTMYSAGLRVSETTHLHYEDISRKNMQIHVRQSKSRSDRYTLLSKRNLELLTEYWFSCGRPTDILFPSKWNGGYISTGTVEQFMRKSVKAAGIEKAASPHSLRHSFACHLLEAGVDARYIQALLGHRDPKSTEVYLHISNKSLMGIESPFDYMRS